MASNLVASKSWFQRFSVAFTLTGGPAVKQQVPVAASQTIIVGDPVTKASGELSKGAANSGALYGIALENVTTTASNELTECLVAVADRNTVFKGEADAQTDGIADGAECDIIASGSTWKVDIGTATEGVCLIVQHVPGDVVDDNTYPGRLYFIIKRSQYDALVAAK